MRTCRQVAVTVLATLLVACVGTSGPPGGATVPTAPSDVTATAGVQSANLTWTLPSSNGGSPLLSYTVSVSPANPSATVTVTGTTASVTGLANGATFTFTVSALNAVGTGPASTSNAITTPDFPGAPTNVIAVAGDEMVSLTWAAPGSTGGSPVTSYRIAISPPAPSAQIVVSGTSATLASLTDGTAYTFTVAAVNAVGTGPASLPSSVVTPTAPTAPPSGLTYPTNPAVYTVGTAIAANRPSSSGGAVASYSVAPALPAGLSLNGLTGVISGMPTVAAATTTYTVTATNALGSTTVGLSITVDSVATSPTLAQRVAFGALFQGVGLRATNFTIRLPNPVGAGNCVVLIMDYTSGLAVSSITDDASNTWPTTAAVTADAGNGLNKTQVFVLENANAGGARSLTITFSATEDNVHFLVLEYYNVATSGAVGVTASSTTAAAPTVTTAAITPTSGSLLLHYATDNANQIGETGTATVSSFTAGSGWTLEAADYASGNSAGPVDMNFYVLQTRLAPGGSVTPTVTTTGTNTVNTVALELKAATGGTPPRAGIRVLRQQNFLNQNLNGTSWKEPFPSSGNLLVVFESQGVIQAPITDSNSNTWTLQVTGVLSDVVALLYAKNPISSSTLVLNFPVTGAPQNTTITVYDLVGADPVNPLMQSVTSGPTLVSGNFTGQPIITPQKPNGVVLVVMGIGLGPITSLTQPSGAYFLSCAYPGETDQDTINNADGYALSYYGSNLATQNYGWGLQLNNDSANATAAEFATAL